MQNVRNCAPLAYLIIGAGISIEFSDYYIRNLFSIAYRNSGEFRNRAEVVVVELLVHSCLFVVETRIRLKRNQHYRTLQFAHKRSEGGACRVCDHVDEENVEIRSLHRRNHGRCLLRIVGHSEAGNLHRMGVELSDENILLFHHILKETGALFPIGIESNAHHADIGG